jgi:hypothetical protein
MNSANIDGAVLRFVMGDFTCIGSAFELDLNRIERLGNLYSHCNVLLTLHQITWSIQVNNHFLMLLH